MQDELLKSNIAFCGVSFPKITYDDAVVNGLLSYYRFLGVPKLFYSEYEESFLGKIFKQVNAEHVESAYLYFNNTASVAALKNARFMQSLHT